MSCVDWKAEARRRALHGFVIEQMVRKLAAAKAREQRAADEEGCGALLCAIRLARRQLIKDLARGAG